MMITWSLVQEIWLNLNIKQQVLIMQPGQGHHFIDRRTWRGGELHLKPPTFQHIFEAVITFFPLSSVQILLISTCCLLCVLYDDM